MVVVQRVDDMTVDEFDHIKHWRDPYTQVRPGAVIGGRGCYRHFDWRRPGNLGEFRRCQADSVTSDY